MRGIAGRSKDGLFNAFLVKKHQGIGQTSKFIPGVRVNYRRVKAMNLKSSKSEVWEMLGDPNEVARDLQQFRRSVEVSSSSPVMDQYSMQWIAVYDGEVRASSKDFDELLSIIDQSEFPRENTLFRFMDPNPRIFIL